MTLAPFLPRQMRSRQPAMAPTYRWTPYRELEEINNRFDQLVQSLAGDVGGWSSAGIPVDVEETEDAYLVDIDLPNINPDDVSIELRGEELRIAGQFEERERTGVLRRQNRPTGEFEIMVDLPSDLDENRVEAAYDNGVLRIMVGKAQDTHPRKIEIKGGHGKREGQKPKRG
jgi:HSP20 family protein